MGICILKYTAEYEPTLDCSIGNDICFSFVSALKLVYFSDLLGFESMHIFG